MHFFKIIDGLGVVHKTSLITMDNASNNNTMMEGLEALMLQRKIPFDRDGNCICWPAYKQAILANPIRKKRSLVATCRSSGQRRRHLRQIIEDGNESGYWKGKLINGQDKLCPVNLLRDCETRWSSTFLMVDHGLVLYPAIRSFLLDLLQFDLSSHLLPDNEINVLCHIHQILEIPHTAQELLSGELTPSLSMALPAYEDLLTKWKGLQMTIPELQHYINVRITKLEEYIGRARKTCIYVHAMVVNPAMKFDWIKKNQLEEDYQNARQWVLESMVKYQKHQWMSATYTQINCSFSVGTTAANALNHGAGRLCSIDVTVHCSLTAPSLSTLTAAEVTPTAAEVAPTMIPCEMTAEEKRAEEERADAEDWRVALHELQRYEEDGLKKFEGKMSDMVSYWNIKDNVYLLLFPVTMDVLPTQASAVPCEWLLEVLQVLKFSHKKNQLSFVDDLIAREEDYTISGQITEAAFDELYKAGKIEELRELIWNSEDDSTSDI
ncbi:uncharacterized protein LACBIDRAFT_309052 [Laccaria bicolor S238N-H82]|uniref:Predicted protein n=1 Tax=Laccaria bicolor (strain S238N-H82 / ATCC MYA-4686) TaxID=486041 RepID=B0CVF0_LACBS|nr:uncharacterized protein LACBIDRAFT_309052 [Laccaria bicolor S238N-H82]EDR13320.1 predicted protein [Laccaria bicolor S238N-H82]|eukprot:XP_001875818.1 predicted protein [Laccaria bicolor S238N-H82]